MIVVDGHNLIPKIAGLSLSDLDDEQSLIELLQRYMRAQRKGAARRIEVFFDQAPPGKAGARTFGSLTAHFVQSGKTADEAIRQYVSGLGKSARNVTVVSSDRQVQVNARALHAAVISSEEFARQLSALASDLSAPVQAVRADPSVGLDDWYDLFGIDPSQAEEPIEPPKSPPQKKIKGESPRRRAHHGFPKK